MLRLRSVVTRADPSVLARESTLLCGLALNPEKPFSGCLPHVAMVPSAHFGNLEIVPEPIV